MPLCTFLCIDITSNRSSTADATSLKSLIALIVKVEILRELKNSVRLFKPEEDIPRILFLSFYRGRTLGDMLNYLHYSKLLQILQGFLTTLLPKSNLPLRQVTYQTQNCF